ncbi:endonuclease V [Agrilutibacter solisilvae]|uniref:Endonuclease V n=1 Tax=Agrilutibacter solisilvae TaxID=2763317 RepID=A0A974Y3I5_9GAMM|nr:endonuclease V [Lysobacter solisilvae]QSX77146.1 endonuclease V [Lysobacter solisilvae]
MAHPVVPEWTGDLAQLQDIQAALARQVVIRDDFPRPVRSVAGFHVRAWPGDANDPDDSEGFVEAAVVLLDADSLQTIATGVHRERARMPYLRGFRSFRELPAMLAALAQLPARPDMTLVPAHGLAHPRRLGLASHLGLAADLPTIGVAQRVLLGHSSTTLHDMRGAFTTLRDERQQVGWLLRSQVGHEPLAVSPGHRVALPSAPELVMRWVVGHRLPEPLRLAELLLEHVPHGQTP